MGVAIFPTPEPVLTRLESADSIKNLNPVGDFVMRESNA